MPVTKYKCNKCQLTFELLGPHHPEEIKCPRCSGKDIVEATACSLEISAPPWEFTCKECKTKFRVEAPKGPDEAKDIKCPRCQSGNIKWHFTVYECVPSGG